MPTSLCPTPPSTATALAVAGGRVPDAGRTVAHAHPITPALGAVVTGLDLARPFDEPTRRWFAGLVEHHQVVFVRDQRLDTDQFAAFVTQFGALGRHPVHDVLGWAPAPTSIVDTAERPPAGFTWHTDLSWVAAPPKWGVLRAIDIPPVGGDTLWASGRTMYERLPAPWRSLADSLSLVHEVDSSLLASIERHHGRAVVEELRRRHPARRHPLVRVHPDTGRRSLWLSPLSTTGVAGLDASESTALLDWFNGRIDDPYVQLRWSWQVGDVAVWDETSTVHRALADHAPARREMQRATVAGAEPPHRR